MITVVTSMLTSGQMSIDSTDGKDCIQCSQPDDFLLGKIDSTSIKLLVPRHEVDFIDKRKRFVDCFEVFGNDILYLGCVS